MKKALSVLVILIIISTISVGQSIKVGIGGGLAVVTGPKFLTNDISKDGLGFGTEYMAGLKGKFSFPVLPVRIIADVNYTLLNGSEDVNFDYSGTPVKASIETETNFLTFGIGAEYSLIPGPISPYVNASVNFTSIGELKVKYKVTTNGVTLPTQEQKLGDKVSRTGLGIGAGVMISILPIIDFDIAANYNIVNLLGKESGEETISTTNFTATVLIGF